MRCECAVCGTYMAHAEDMKMGCVCPACKARCSACLGTNTLLSKEDLHALKGDPFFESRFLDGENPDD
ncbi:hypothetical protein [Christensenella timonensis]|uniref:hypothetical protein n=1 Tax=Christensenella timonensis TaxID=1816678 RepID=UPI00082BE60D|nr:hypothetical protein [Christensenella timonensis]